METQSGGEKKSVNYYRRYMGDYMRDTMHLSMLEHGAYNLLLDATYATEKPLPADYEGLNRLCRAMSSAEKKAAKAVADQFFPIQADGFRHNHRASKEIGIAQSTIAKQRDSGVKSAKKRWVNDGLTHKSTDELTHGLTNPPAIQPPTTNHQEKEKPLSGEPDAAAEVLDYLNASCQAAFEPVDANLRLIRSRLAEFGRERLLRVVDAKVREWRGTDQAMYLRPKTLFNATNCANYIGQLNGVATAPKGPSW